MKKITIEDFEILNISHTVLHNHKYFKLSYYDNTMDEYHFDLLETEKFKDTGNITEYFNKLKKSREKTKYDPCLDLYY